jgi:hypothetical protein
MPPFGAIFSENKSIVYENNNKGTRRSKERTLLLQN